MKWPGRSDLATDKAVEGVDHSRRALLSSAGLLALSAAGGSRAGSAAPEPVLDVVIIGAGLAGLTAARDLMRAGNESFVVLEARNRVGGRTLNHRLRDGYVSEAGGQWIGPGQTAIDNLARELGVGTFKSEYSGKSVYQLGQGRVSVDTHGKFQLDDPALGAELDALARTLDPDRPWASPKATELDQISVGHWLQARSVNSIDMLSFRLSAILAAGSGVFDISLLYFLSMIQTAGGIQGLLAQKAGAQERRFQGGSQILCARMAGQLGERLRLEHPVRLIEDWDRPTVRVHAAGRLFKARSVVVALSPPLCNALAYAPALPPERTELQRRWPAHAPMLKSAAVYPTPFWFAKGYNGQIANAEGPLIWSYDNSPPDLQLGVINAFLRLGDTPTDHAQAQTAVARIYAQAMRDERLLRPLEFHLQDWGQEPYTLSCVSPMPPGLLTSGLMPALKEPVGALIWAGTETADIWFGYMDGAVRSGQRAALRALQRLALPGRAGG